MRRPPFPQATTNEKLAVASPVARTVAAEDIAEKRRLWLAENHDAMAAWNDYVECCGVPLASYRQF